jgi:hypothetical protein
MKRIDQAAWEREGPGNSADLPGRSVFSARPWAWLAFARRPELLPRMALAARPGVLVLMAGLLAGLWLVLGYGTGPKEAPPADRAGLLLLAEHSSPKLDKTSAEASARPPAAAPQVELDRRSPDATGTATPPPAVAPAPVQAAPNPLPPLDPLPPVELPRVSPPVEPAPPPPAAAEPLENCFASRDSQRGDTPMTGSWKMLGLQTVLAAALLTPAAGAADEPDKITALTKQIGDLRAAVESLEKTVKERCGDLRTDVNLSLEKHRVTQTDLDRLKGDIAQLRQDIEAVRKLLPTTQVSGYPPDARSDMEQMRRLVDQMRQDLEALRRGAPATRIAGFPPTTDTARVRLVNTFPAPMHIVVNGRAYVLEPGESRWSDPISFGTFTYEVLGVRPPQTRVLNPGDPPFTITVFPR